MANVGNQKITVPLEELPQIQFTTLLNGGVQEIDSLYYDFRYRIISEDKNKFSHWSAIQRTVHPDLGSNVFANKDTGIVAYPYTNRMTITSSGTPTTISATWVPPTSPTNLFEDAINKKRVYDVWVRWNNSKTLVPTAVGWSAWQYATRTTSNNFLIPKGDAGRQSVDIAIQLPTEVKIRDFNNNKLTLFRQISDTI
jgi:hypothetical protein